MSNSNNSSVGISSFDKLFKISADLNINLALCGAHGRAKTSIVSQYCEKNGYDLTTIILSRMTPEDMIGLPVISDLDNEKVTSFSCPDWLAHASDGKSKVLLFFDEFNNAEFDVQASILDLIESRKANGKTLNKDCQIVMAFNPSSITPNANSLAKATRDRICVIPVLDSSSEKDYKKYYTDNGMQELCDVIDSIEGLVNNYDDEVIEESYKSAEFTYRTLEKSYKIVQYCIDNKLPRLYANVMVKGYAGKIGSSFVSSLYDIIYKNSGFTKIKEIVIKNGINYFTKNFEHICDEVFDHELTFDDNIIVVNAVKEVVDPVELDKFLNKVFTKEFISRYDAIPLV